ncbi:MAG: NADH-quinone oxidoreductase subunit NuoE [Dehalococcoidia bacterium]|jgi:NADH-quinone oxidoreductase subunit E
MISPSEVQGAPVLVTEQGAMVAERLDEILSSYQGEKDDLIPILQHVQQVFGYLPEPAMRKIAKFLKLPESTVFGVGTFYVQFKLLPTGRNVVKVCRGTACHVRGSAQLLAELEKRLGVRAGETTPDLEYSLETIACFGSCALAPVVVSNDKVYGRMTDSRMGEILNKEAQR